MPSMALSLEDTNCLLGGHLITLHPFYSKKTHMDNRYTLDMGFLFLPKQPSQCHYLGDHNTPDTQIRGLR